MATVDDTLQQRRDGAHTAQAWRFVRLVDEWRRDLGLTHRQFAARLGRPEAEWWHYRAGRRDPSPAFVRAVFRHTDDSWREILTRAYAGDVVARVTAPAAPAAPVA